MGKSYRRKGGYKKKNRTRKARRGGMFSTLQAHMDKGKQMANQHYENALKKAGPQAEKMRQQAVGKLTEMQKKASPILQKAQQQAMQEAGPMVQKAQQQMSKMLNEAANRSQRGVAQANIQFGSPAAIATGNPTMKK